MDQTITTVYFDGQFWAAMIEKINADGSLFIGRHIFGAEPSNAKLREFYLYEYIRVPVYQSEIRVRIKKRVSVREQERTSYKSRIVFAAVQKSYFEEKKMNAKKNNRERKSNRSVQNGER